MAREVTGLDYDVVDVFAEQPFAGNQLAVVHGADGLSDAQLLTLAREFNFSETTFPTPLPDRTGTPGYRVRIFTPGGEIPFAGHPTLGTAWVLRSAGLVDGPDLTQLCAAGEIAVRLEPDGDLVELTAVARDLAGPLPDEPVAALLADLGLSADDRTGEAWVAGAGLNFVHLPVTDEAVGRARPGRTPVPDQLDVPGLDLQDPLDGVNLVAIRPGDDGVEVHARVFVPGLSVPEDPATGSAAAGLGIALVATGVLPDGGHYRIRQGVEMGRPSRLAGFVEVTGTPGATRASRCRVGGRVHPVARGRIAVPPPA